MKGVIHWVSAVTGLPAEFRLYDRLFSVPNPAAEDDFTAINPESLAIRQGFVEQSLATAKRVNLISLSVKAISVLTVNTQRLRV